MLLVETFEDVDIHKIKHPNTLFYGSDRSETNELVDSIMLKGLLQPIIVRPKCDFFEIVAGCRRYSACKSLGFRKIMCHVMELDDQAAFEISLMENIQRKSLDPIEEASAFKVYVDDFGWGGIAELALKIGKSSSYVCKRLSLLELPTELLEKVSKLEVSPSTAEELIPLKDLNKRHQIADIIMKNGCSSKEIRALVELNQHQWFSPYDHMESNAYHSLDKSIVALKIATGKIATIIETIADNWIIYELLMHHKNILNTQIDIMIREKNKLRKLRKLRM